MAEADRLNHGISEATSPNDNKCPVHAIHDGLTTKSLLEMRLFNQQIQKQRTSHCQASAVNDVELAKHRISDLRKELLHHHCKFAQKELVLKRLQLSAALTKELFDNSADRIGLNNADLKHSEVKDCVLGQTSLVSEIMESSSLVNVEREKLLDLRKENFSLSVQNRQTMQQIQDYHYELEERAKDLRKTEEGQRKKEQLEDEITKLKIQSQTLLGIILGSGLNWAQDEHLEELVMKLGTPLDV